MVTAILEAWLFGQVVDQAGRAIQGATKYDASTYVLVVVLVMVAGFLVLHFLNVTLPESKDRREEMKIRGEEERKQTGLLSSLSENTSAFREIASGQRELMMAVHTSQITVERNTEKLVDMHGPPETFHTVETNRKLDVVGAKVGEVAKKTETIEKTVEQLTQEVKEVKKAITNE